MRAIMKIHGDIKISRRTDIKPQSDYKKYREDLRRDFGYICGYCGKSEAVTKNMFEIDHFIPKKYAPEREKDYSNLVYSCSVCNWKKSSKWISKKANIQFVNDEGFVDPATEDYHNHLARNAEGNIVALTKAGKYMVEKGFEFDIRPMKEIWQAMQLIEKKELLREKKKLSSDERKEYILFDEQLEALQKYLFNAKE